MGDATSTSQTPGSTSTDTAPDGNTHDGDDTQTGNATSDDGNPSDSATGDGETSTDPGEDHEPGYLHTSGARIVDSLGNPVRLTGITWLGLDTDSFAPHGLWRRTIASIVEQLASRGYNCIRVPFSNELLQPESMPDSVGGDPSLAGANGLEVLDALVASASLAGMKVILSRFRYSPAAESDLWHDAAFSEDDWVRDWERLTARYLGDSTVVAMDLHEAPGGPAEWASSNAHFDWRRAATRAGNSILGVNDQVLVMVQGVEQYGDDRYWPGGSLRGVAPNPITLDSPNQLVYATRIYPRSVKGGEAWQPATPGLASLAAEWDERWGYVSRTGIAPVVIAAFGSSLDDDWDRGWFSAVAQYVDSENLSFFYWVLNPSWGETGGLLDPDWETIIERKQQALDPMLAPFISP